jgi:hypothetical protein
MELVPVILAWLLTLQPSSLENEPYDKRKARLEIVAEAWGSVADEMMCDNEFAYQYCQKLWKGSKVKLVVSLGTQAWHESKLAKYVQDGNCRRWECDPVLVRDSRGVVQLDEQGDPVIEFRARSMFQLHASTEETRYVWHNITGSDYEAVRNAAWAMANYYRRNYCGGNIAGMFSSGSGKGCAVSPRGARRAEWYYKELRSFSKIWAGIRRQRAQANNP